MFSLIQYRLLCTEVIRLNGVCSVVLTKRLRGRLSLYITIDLFVFTQLTSQQPQLRHTLTHHYFFLLQKYLDELEQPCNLITEGSLLSKVSSLLNKAKTLCKDTITNTGYPSLVQALDDFVTVVIETSTHLGSLEVRLVFVSCMKFGQICYQL